MCLYFALMYKTLGGYRWTDLYKTILPDDECAIDADIVQSVEQSFQTDAVEETILNTAKMSLDGLKAVRFANLRYLVFITYYMKFTDFYNRSLSWVIWICHLVELFCLVWCLFIRLSLSIVFHKAIN